MLRKKHLYLSALTAAVGAGGLASMAQTPIAAGISTALATPANSPAAFPPSLAEPLTEEQLEAKIEAAKPTAPRIWPLERGHAAAGGTLGGRWYGASQYQAGVANGLILAVSVFDGQEPQFVGFNLPDPKGSTHQERVGIERAELDARAEKLEQFIHGDVFTTLPADEQERLLKQHGLMAELSAVLADRIAHFPA